jgi:hypothetical protein
MGTDEDVRDSESYEALEVDWEAAISWASARGFVGASDEPEGIENGRAVFLLLPADEAR